MKAPNRVYQRKAEPFGAKLVVTMTERMLGQVKAAAQAAGLPASEWTRFLISEALRERESA